MGSPFRQLLYHGVVGSSHSDFIECVSITALSLNHHYNEHGSHSNSLSSGRLDLFDFQSSPCGLSINKSALHQYSLVQLFEWLLIKQGPALSFLDFALSC